MNGNCYATGHCGGVGSRMNAAKKFGWFLVAALGAVALSVIATSRGESINAVWLVAAAACVYVIGYRFYSRWIAYRVLGLDDSRATPAERLEDGRDFVVTD